MINLGLTQYQFTLKDQRPRIMKLKALLAFTLFSSTLSAQNIFPVKLSNCKADQFCLDCGDTKATYDQKKFSDIIDNLNKSLNLQGIEGTVKFQVLVSKDGNACVLSHTDKSNNPISLKIIDELNQLDNWHPAVTNSKKEEKTSITLAFTIANNKLSGDIERVDIDDFKQSFDKPESPEIYNKNYTYKNENLKNYKMTVWNSKNSTLPNNMIDHISIANNGLIWMTVDEGLVTFNGKEFNNPAKGITPKDKYFQYYALATDNNNTTWIYAKDNIYSCNNAKWEKYDSTIIGISGANEIVNCSRSGEVFFSSSNGLVILKDNKWSKIDKRTLKQLPSNNISYANRDSKNRLWIGTYSGTVMIDNNGAITNFEKTSTILRGKTITSMDEDENGNLYFTLYEFNPKDEESVNNDDGIAIRYADGSLKQFTTSNSGMPFNGTTCILYDKNEKVVWISTDRAGLVRYDLKDGWENYHNENSDIPTSYISTMTFNDKGTLFLATRQGLVIVERKNK